MPWVIHLDLEEQILRYYLKVFSFTFYNFYFFISFLYSLSLNKDIEIKNNPISINKGDSIEEVLKNNIHDVTFLDIIFIKIYMKINSFINKNFHYGDFNIKVVII